jgi:hypothetical protein
VTASARTTIATLTIVLATVSAAHAQGFAHTPVEVGVSVGSVVSWFTEPFNGGDFRVTVPVNDIGDVEVLGGLPTVATRHDASPASTACSSGNAFARARRQRSSRLPPTAAWVSSSAVRTRGSCRRSSGWSAAACSSSLAVASQYVSRRRASSRSSSRRGSGWRPAFQFRSGLPAVDHALCCTAWSSS